ncbi:Tll0287-like domain-containing protein [Olleya namhaensis]|uniref:Tll0287-like domain-containing protein n=1 Tax=Olleya namhaensis TaxID=1144750 RepID=UPI00232F8C86|nr:DUF3365 domain-containing protein [Olleya namhaensis]
MKHLILLGFLSMLLFNCNNSNKKEYTAFGKQMEASKHPGKKLMETNCYTCHSPTASHDDRIAPPMVAIKKHYINSETTKAQFITSILSWINNPNLEDAKMFGAVKRFGIMPKQAFPEETITHIADYMFDYDIEEPEWFEDHFNEEKGRRKGKGKGKGKGRGEKQGQAMKKQQANVDLKTLSYGERGLKYALTTKAVLGKSLMETIQKKGNLEALVFCSEKAYPLTDSMALVHNAIIKRVSDKPRNKNNLANAKELTYINSFKNDINNNKEPKSIVDLSETKVHVYYPILTNTMCLQCHGKSDQDIKKPTLNKLASLYPQDKATGYGVNQVRGVWSITFDR